NAGLAAVLIGVAFVFRPPVDAADPAGLGRIGLLALAVAEAAIVLYWATIGRALASIRPAILGTACVAGLVALVTQAIAASTGRAMTTQLMTNASFLSS